jgi:hypothetical protein
MSADVTPIVEQATRYRCPHCRKSYAHRATAHRHMVRCFRNPAVRSCKTCRHFGLSDEGYECDMDVLEAGPMCSQCGLGLDHNGECANGHADKPLYGMRVQCDEWEANDG